jgi:hypothetical protein
MTQITSSAMVMRWQQLRCRSTVAVREGFCIPFSIVFSDVAELRWQQLRCRSTVAVERVSVFPSVLKGGCLCASRVPWNGFPCSHKVLYIDAELSLVCSYRINRLAASQRYLSACAEGGPSQSRRAAIRRVKPAASKPRSTLVKLGGSASCD